MDKKLILSKVNIGNSSHPITGLLCGEICEAACDVFVPVPCHKINKKARHIRRAPVAQVNPWKTLPCS